MLRLETETAFAEGHCEVKSMQPWSLIKFDTETLSGKFEVKGFMNSPNSAKCLIMRELLRIYFECVCG